MWRRHVIAPRDEKLFIRKLVLGFGKYKAFGFEFGHCFLVQVSIVWPSVSFLEMP